MVPLIAAVGVGAVVWVGYSSFRKHMNEIKAREAAKAAESAKVSDLEKDPETGRYRPKK